MDEEDETSEDPSAPIESELKTAGADALYPFLALVIGPRENLGKM